MATTGYLSQNFNFQPGRALLDGSALQKLINILFSVKSGIVALAGGGQVGATPLPAKYNQVATVATAADSVMLPPALGGSEVWLDNLSAAAPQVFGQVGDTIAAHNSAAQQPTATGVSHPASTLGCYVCTVPGQWKQSYSA